MIQGQQRIKKRIFGLLAGGFGIICSVVPALAEAPGFSVGIVPQFETRVLCDIWQPVLNALSRRTGYVFFQEGAPSIPDFETAFMAGKYDIAYMNPYHYIVACRTQGYIPLVRDTGRSLQGVLVVKKASGISTVGQLSGKRIAFPSPNALGASLQMRQELHDLFGLAVTPVYVKTHDSVYLNVLLGKTAAGGGVQKTLGRQPEKYRDRLQIIHTTRPVPSHPIVAHPRLGLKVRRRIQEALLAMGETPEGRAVLAGIPILQLGRAAPEDYAPLRGMQLERFYVPPK